MPRILTGVPVVCSAKPTERRKPGCTPVSHATSGVGVPPGGTAGCAHAWHGIANAMQVATRVHGFMHAAPGDEGESRKTPMTDATAIRRHSVRGRAPIGRRYNYPLSQTPAHNQDNEIGSASCRERECQYV